MKIHNSDKIIAWMALLSGLAISTVAIYYSVAGLVSIFAAAAIPIIVMGAALEISKLVATVWLKLNWKRAPVFIRTYLLIAIAVLMVITSMGIFGFLSKAHSDQSLISGDVQSKLAIYDEKIKTAKENIEADRKQLKQMDEAVDQVMARSTSEEGATKANAIRKSQQRDRTALAKDIEANQKLIASLNDEAAPIRAEIRKVEAEVGPIKYIAKLIYSDNPDANILEKAVTWVILIIVAVFDPLAVILLLASQYSFQWFRDEKDKELDQAEGDSLTTESKDNIVEPTTVTQPAEEESPKERFDPHPIGWAFPKHANIQEYQVEDADEEIAAEEEPKFNEVQPLTEWDESQQDEEILNSVALNEKAAMQAWKHDHPNDSLKKQRKLFEHGVISKLPWEDYMKSEVDFAAEEAKKWADENPNSEEAKEAAQWASETLDERPGDYVSNGLTYMENVDGHQVKKTVDGYQQNAEQSEETLWQRIQNAKK